MRSRRLENKADRRIRRRLRRRRLNGLATLHLRRRRTEEERETNEVSGGARDVHLSIPDVEESGRDGETTLEFTRISSVRYISTVIIG